MSRTSNRVHTKSKTRRAVNNATKSTVKRARQGKFSGRIKVK